MSKLDCEDGINEAWWDKEMSKPIDYFEEAKRITRDHQDEFFWRDAHATLVSLQNLLAAQNALGLLTNFTEVALKAAKAQLDREFATHAQPEDDDLAF